MYNIKFLDLLNSNLKPNPQWIFKDPHPILREVTQDIEGNELSKDDIYYLKKMVRYIDVCYHNQAKKYKIRSGIAIAANQVGWNKRATYIHFNDEAKEHHYLLINPHIIKRSSEIAYLNPGEGCLSVDDDRSGYVIRNKKVHVKAYDLISEQFIDQEFSGIIAICIQHEIGHLDAGLYYDNINQQQPFYADPSWTKIGR
ncbi:peptide deformylase [Ureaplasma parvum]|uniref:Peptide deformylase n=2 Tax=Ureaplasma parvum serovar 3 TaxID=38504 RepID=DEF_UREPA|nr:peptide deformylase [Ureaplasma parvum]B1AJA6.1 RecName: Full=Peptide deformylase; Short=PDF; AltName: Full=Polypeptide deformylase [Ureaplasma parvum serovar 3 str. ATCC 27815]Q9PQ25.1 RecName: Full=Peptide deformylase; Short=PDF; AltName: Full=Polypeptide deformylase [Ureaplasma parvum serovar 3 str. ATCC 700970]pir/F82886/ polypeptide deformylase UU465 [imported] - Ureaplasma urealyticum [Ureaplasma urealyticum]AAF30877.1 polypeptide deformylase [Ureaplasma parvum serovar 3 str. ATCC 7009